MDSVPNVPLRFSNWGFGIVIQPILVQLSQNIGVDVKRTCWVGGAFVMDVLVKESRCLFTIYDTPHEVQWYSYETQMNTSHNEGACGDQ